MRRVILLTIVVSLLFVSRTFALGAGDTLWTRTYGGSLADYGQSVQQTTDGGYILVGFTLSFGAGNRDVYLLKTDANGDTVWTRTYGGGSNDYGYSVQQTTEGGYVIAGWTDTFGSVGHVYLLKTDADGDTLWTRVYGGSDLDRAYSVQQTGDGGYVVAGQSNSFGAGLSDVYLLKTDANGDTLWTRTYGGHDWDYGQSVQQTVDGGYIIAGYTSSFGAGGYDFYLIKTDANGTALWSRTYGGPGYDFGYSLDQTTDGGYVVAGYTYSFGIGGDVYLVKTDANGDTLWTRTYGGTASDYAQSVQETSDGGYIVTGSTESFGNMVQVYLVKTDANGDTLWTRAHGGTLGEVGRSVQQTTDGGYIVAGQTDSFGAGEVDIYLVKTVAEGGVELECEDYSPWFCRGDKFYFKLTVINETGEYVSGSLSFRGHEGYDCDPWNTLITIPRDKTYPPGVTNTFYSFKVPNAAGPGQYSASVKGTLNPGGFEVFCCMNTDIVECSPWRLGNNTAWELVEVEHPEPHLPTVTELFSNYPNPFNAETSLGFALPEAGKVSLKIYDITGRLMTTLVEAYLDTGEHLVTWDASEVSSGLYFYKLTAGDFTETRRMMLVK